MANKKSSKKITRTNAPARRVTAKKTVAAKRAPQKIAPVSVAVKPAPIKITSAAKPARDGSRTALYIYWIIIVFFVGATFYVLGRGYGILHPTTLDSEITETMPATAPATTTTTTPAALVPTTAEIAAMTNSARADLAKQMLASGHDKLVSGDSAGAVADLSVAIQAAPKVSLLYVLRAEGYMQAADYTNATSDLNNAVALDNNNSAAFYDRAMLNVRMGNFDAAKSDITDAVRANTAMPSTILTMHDIYAKYGQINLWAKDFQGAITQYTNAIAADATVYADFAGRAEAYTDINNYAAAADDYMSAVSLIARDVQGNATTSQKKAMSTDAMSYFEKMAALHVKLGDTDTARVDLQSAITLASAPAINDTDTVKRLTDLLNTL